MSAFKQPWFQMCFFQTIFNNDIQTRGLHWVWAPAGPTGPNTNLAEAGCFTFAAGRSGRSENFAGDPRGTVGFGV